MTITKSGKQNFIKSFPNKCLNILLSESRVQVGSGNDTAGMGAAIVSNTQFNITQDWGTYFPAYLLAIGY